VIGPGEQSGRELDGRIYLRWRDFSELLTPGSGLCIDVGCGMGASRQTILALGYRYVGLDLRKTSGTSVVGDAARLPFLDECADLVVSRQVFEHLPHPHAAAREINRILKPGGVFCGSTSLLEPFHDSFFNFTHLGLVQLLSSDAGFGNVRIEAGPNVALFVVYYFFDMLGLLPIAQRMSPVIAWMLFGPVFLLLRIIHAVKGWTKVVLRLKSGHGAAGLWSLHSLSWAGYLLFHASKGSRN
jgi:SAM-dependent methyltransferase